MKHALTAPLLASTCKPLAKEQAKTALHAIGTDCFGPTYQRSAAFWTTKNVRKPVQHAKAYQTLEVTREVTWHLQCLLLVWYTFHLEVPR